MSVTDYSNIGNTLFFMEKQSVSADETKCFQRWNNSETISEQQQKKHTFGLKLLIYE